VRDAYVSFAGLRARFDARPGENSKQAGFADLRQADDSRLHKLRLAKCREYKSMIVARARPGDFGAEIACHALRCGTFSNNGIGAFE
jgi:hypothetical protein